MVTKMTEVVQGLQGEEYGLINAVENPGGATCWTLDIKFRSVDRKWVHLQVMSNIEIGVEILKVDDVTQRKCLE